jgi:hypothetical protein
MSQAAPAAWNVGFLTIVRETAGFLGGYLVTNPWGRPLEFRLSTAVQPNRVQQILYGATLEPYVCADLIGKTLIEKTAAPAQVIVTDTEAALDVRQRLDVPVALLRTTKEAGDSATPGLTIHPRFPHDSAVVGELRERLGTAFDLNEPFLRIREAIGEARKMGVTSRG